MAEPLYPLLSLSRHRIGIDGVGVTTLIAGAGCPLRCRWCINRRLLAEAKPTPVTARELYERVRVDDLYFRATGGGVCFGGGEALLHADFIAAFGAICGESWRVNMETSLAVPQRAVETAAQCPGAFFIVDCKDMDDAIYRRYTGGDGARMRENLRLLLALVGPERLRVRVPLIPEFNTPDDQARSVEALRALGVTDIETFSYVIRDRSAP